LVIYGTAELEQFYNDLVKSGDIDSSENKRLSLSKKDLIRNRIGLFFNYQNPYPSEELETSKNKDYLVLEKRAKKDRDDPKWRNVMMPN
jgi:hypothetical protein